ncbi:related to Rpa34 - 34 kD subunit of DNA-directed RNA polymerase I [Melanopsichium pennsylvanicum]|uniref:Related to Rpa34 - 34 kD subunit of DNA-directed RNA polymerase I n=2 Tax=Melanopsichium pennsylvanicum TaxID=63383 RepID=A0AAJ4XFV2_9BASI|nr:related to Rpa34-34 kD subunit of DNA-directed RNA polymerase I [Melanopsichium pennsylvanicum 4]SNX81577.1 related to Rpa34 - 34 kD subunit of DNA-directed RNA polymerase I [Melanopsichium pennsylvanicum]
MSNRSRSDSESSSSSSSSGSSVEAQTASVSTAKLPASRSLSSIGYRPPRGFEPVPFSASSPFLQNKLSTSKEQQLWAIRIPAGLSPSQLNGIVIDLPRDTTNLTTASKPLGTIQVQTSSPSVIDTYNFYASVSSAVKGKGKKPSSADSQLIAMASENTSKEDEDASIASGQGAATELESLHLLVPAGDGKEDGKLVLAPVKMERHLHLSIASPAETTRRAKVKETSNRFEEKKLPQQPWHLLKGHFKPAGSRNTTELDAPTSRGAEESKDKRENKRKAKSEDEKEAKKSKTE